MAQSDTGKRLLVVSGGGSRGAWGVGFAQYLHDTRGYKHRMVVGTSTGALMAPMVVLERYDRLATEYTTVNQRSIFNKNPFKKDGGVRGFYAFRRLGKRTLGESENLRKRICNLLVDSTYQRLLADTSVNFAVAVANHRTHEVKYRFLKNRHQLEEGVGLANDVMPRDSLVNWIWASANEPVFMSLYSTPNANGQTDYWVDGGLRENVPVMKGLLLASDPASDFDAVDVIINHTPATDDAESTWPTSLSKKKRPTVVNTLFQTLKTLRYGVRDMNLRMADLFDKLRKAQDKIASLSSPIAGSAVASLNGGTAPATRVPASVTDSASVTLNFYFMPDSLYKLVENELLFDQNIMKQWLKAGRNGEHVPGKIDSQPVNMMSQEELRNKTIPDPATPAVQYRVTKEALRAIIKKANE